MNKELIEKNKLVVKDILTKLGTDSITVEYSGSCDSGAIDDIDFSNDDIEDTTFIYYSEKPTKGPDSKYHNIVVESEQSATNFIESFCYELLSQEYGGWENDSGGQGTFYFTLETPESDVLIKLNHAEAYEETETREYNL